MTVSFVTVIAGVIEVIVISFLEFSFRSKEMMSSYYFLLFSKV